MKKLSAAHIEQRLVLAGARFRSWWGKDPAVVIQLPAEPFEPLVIVVRTHNGEPKPKQFAKRQALVRAIQIHDPERWS